MYFDYQSSGFLAIFSFIFDKVSSNFSYKDSFQDSILYVGTDILSTKFLDSYYDDRNFMIDYLIQPAINTGIYYLLYNMVLGKMLPKKDSIGLELENIIPDDPQLPPTHQRQIIKDIFKINIEELQSLKQKNEKQIQEANIENSNLRRKSVDIKINLNKQLEQKDEEIDFQNKKLIQTNKKQKYLTLLQNMRIFLDKYNKKLEQILKDKTTRIKYLQYQNYKVGGIQLNKKDKPEDFRKAQDNEVQETLQNIQDFTQSQIDSIDKIIKKIEKQEKLNKKDLSKFINSLQEFASQLSDNQGLDEKDHQKSFEQYQEIFSNLKEKAPQQNNLSDLNLTDSEYFRINELDNFDNEIQINQKIDELEQANQINSDFDEIQNQSRVSEHQKMIEMLRNKLDEIQNKKIRKQNPPRRRDIFDEVLDNYNENKQSDSLFNFLDNFGKN